jgi:ketosteroid isomerase-like protein
LLPATTGHAQATPNETVERLHRAIAQGDRTAASATLAANVRIFESGYVERSRDEYLSHHFEADAKFAQTVKRKVVWRSEQMAGDTALLLAETESSGSFKGKPIKLFGLETIVLRHVDGEWNIVHIHWSSRKR